MKTKKTKNVAPVNSEARYTVYMQGGVGCELLVNDIPVLDNDYPGIISKFLINPWLINGRNTFKIRSLLLDSATKNHPQWDPSAVSFCKVVISGPKEKGMPDTKLAQTEVKLLKPSDYDSVLSKNGSFTVIIGYPNPAWAQSEKIGKDATTQEKILDKYREFHRLLESKDLNGIMKFSSAKSKDYSKSTYTDFESRLKDSFNEKFASTSELIGIDVQEKYGLRYEYYYSDRLVTIKNVKDQSIIQYYDGDEGVTTEYTLLFYFDGKDFVLIL